MAERLLKISIEGAFGDPYETAKKTIEIIKHNDGKYYCKHTRLNKILQKETIKKVIDKNKIIEITSMLSAIRIPAFPNHQMGCDGGFTEIEIGDYSGKSHFRWWSSPPSGWEELDEVTQFIIETINTENA